MGLVVVLIVGLPLGYVFYFQEIDKRDLERRVSQLEGQVSTILGMHA